MRLSGDPDQRKQQKAAQRRRNEVEHGRAMGLQAQTGHDKVVAVTQSAKAASRRMSDEASRRMALEIAQVVERFDRAENWSRK